MNFDLLFLTIAGVICIVISYIFGFIVGFKYGYDKEGKYT